MKIKVNKSTFELIKGDIVNAANKQLAPGGGVAGAIHEAAGPELWKECKELDGCETGEAKLTKGYELPASHVIHTVGPVYSNSPDDPKLLASSYHESLKLAEDHNIHTISFPAISTGAFRYPMEEAAEVAIKTIIDYLKQSTKISLVRLVLYDSKALKVHERILADILQEENGKGVKIK